MSAALPLFESDMLYRPNPKSLFQIRTSPEQLIPTRKPQLGEQYRFHFDMTKCIGCKCCVVACNEQNGNPAGINWRRVGEIEGGHYPYTQRHHLSMVEKIVKTGENAWTFHVNVSFKGREMTVPLPLEVKWVGDTP